jgi:thymidylate synthase
LCQRSADLGLGVPFNIASYALLTHLIAHVTGLYAGEFVHTLGDAHVYCNHVDTLKEQLQRVPRPFPTVSINKDKSDDIDAITSDDIKLSGYKPHGKLPMNMAV